VSAINSPVPPSRPRPNLTTGTSRGANRSLALSQLAGRLFLLGEGHGPAERERPVRGIVLHPYRRARDVQTGAETADTDAVLDGDIGLFLEAWARQPGRSKDSLDQPLEP
jgi:hypothetical protein